MTRLHTDPVEVRTRADLPDQFLWRGRLYLVREVHARWTEAGGWWRGAAMSALATGDTSTARPAVLETAPIPSSPKWAQRAWGEPAPDVGAAVGPAVGVDDGERSWWRVEAASGRASAGSSGPGVYDLCLDTASGSWSLARVMD